MDYPANKEGFLLILNDGKQEIMIFQTELLRIDPMVKNVEIFLFKNINCLSQVGRNLLLSSSVIIWRQIIKAFDSHNHSIPLQAIL